MVKFAAAGYVCVDYYPDFNNRYYITGNGVDGLYGFTEKLLQPSVFCQYEFKLASELLPG